MARFYIKTIVEFSNELECDTAEEAEALGWEWEDQLNYDGVYDITVERLDDEEEEED